RRGEVALCGSPLGDRGDHAADELPDTALTLRRAERATEVLRDDDVGGELRPCARHLDVTLLEDGLATLALDHCRAHVPLDVVIGVRPGKDEMAAQGDACGAGVGGSVGRALWGRFAMHV